MMLIKSDTVEQTVVENGKKKKVTIAVPLEMRVDCAKWVSRFCYPVLSASQITGADDGPVQFENTLDISAILANPELAAVAQDLALKIAALERNQYRAERCLPEPSMINHPDFER